MKQTIVKRPANITSQKALSQLATEYPHSEILSFRRVKSAGMDGDYFVATLRIAEFDEIEESMDDDDIITESEKHEESEEDKLDKIIDMLKKLIEKDEGVHKMIDEDPGKNLLAQRPPLKNPVPMQPMANKNCQCWDGYKRVPGTKPCASGSCKKCDSARKNSMARQEREDIDIDEPIYNKDPLFNKGRRPRGCAAWNNDERNLGTPLCSSCDRCINERKRKSARSLIVKRNADVSQKRARLELIREFGKEYKISRFAKTGSVYSAVLVKRTNDECQCCKDGSCNCDCHKDGMNKAMNAVDTAANLVAEAKRKRLASLRKRGAGKADRPLRLRKKISPEQQEKLNSLYKICPECNGKGRYESDHPEADDEMECGDCDGSGIVEN